MTIVHRHTIETSLPEGEARRVLASLIAADAVEALASIWEEGGRPLTGREVGEGFQVSLIQRGRVVPMPRTRVALSSKGQGCELRLTARPGLNAFFNLAAFSAFAAALCVLAVMDRSPGLLALLVFPLGFITMSVWWLKREAQHTTQVIQAALKATEG